MCLYCLMATNLPLQCLAMILMPFLVKKKMFNPAPAMTPTPVNLKRRNYPITKIYKFEQCYHRNFTHMAKHYNFRFMLSFLLMFKCP
ncbi:hypothetical protein ACB098_06G049100 [Castanea mollissima]